MATDGTDMNTKFWGAVFLLMHMQEERPLATPTWAPHVGYIYVSAYHDA